MRSFTIADRTITDGSPAFVIAELSHNHLGSLALAREMVRLAAEAGADAVKLQRRGPSTYEGLRAAGPELAEYAAMRQAREFDQPQYMALMDYAREQGMAFIATAFDVESLEFLHHDVPVDAIKIASGDITNTPLLEYAAGLRKPLIVSTGGADMDDVRRAHEMLARATRDFTRFALLHCTSEYPAAAENWHLRVVTTLREAFPDTVVGFSSHTHRNNGPVAEILAALLGARVLEKHFTLTPDLGGEHAFALRPLDLRHLTSSLPNLPLTLGDGTKRVLNAEVAGIERLGKHLAAARDLETGHAIGRGDLAVRAPGLRGMPPHRLEALLGRRLARGLKAHEPINEGDLEGLPAKPPPNAVARGEAKLPRIERQVIHSPGRA